eukprot:CAMPEP_0179273550 /NCGR_PEP_ID=MMETSP0797-20121207/33070_1 /TAXON_ID=47934 /ORGANISM="Dinophysis acuminata, Strain DAEP01" /LENGTH=62 /DNA_ID=CAMNT_0020981979 /DNA_START=61 /DNA_END=246 /DNA_ORIENTATION=-
MQDSYGNSNLMNAGAHIMMSQSHFGTPAASWGQKQMGGPNTTDRLDCLEQELHHLKMLRQQG